MNTAELANVLNLDANYRIIINNPVGYPPE
jgi:hypothetical protein